MRRSGYSVLIILLIVFVPLLGACDEKKYDEKKMGQLATFVRVIMDIVSTEYIDRPIPKEVSEKQIVEIVKKDNTDFQELKLLDTYDIVMVSDGVQLGAVVWDPDNGRKLIQDLRCTKSPDELTWSQVVYGQEFTLSWGLCAK
ncbi:MAG: hypothetical protein HZA17_12185 [Nitrospirae bacterium]|nr:hypothetical protein [Nitrospirota bacterium]